MPEFLESTTPSVASDSVTWADRSHGARRRWLQKFRHLIVVHKPELIALVMEEIGKPEHEVLTAELLPLLASCRWHERHAEKLLKPRRLIGRPIWQFGQRHTACRAPLGTVGIIATWNYPIQLLGVQLIQALIAGNSVIVKPSERSPRSQIRLLELAVRAGLPSGVLRWTEATREAGPTMLREHDLDHIVFTGSTEVGRQIAAYAAERFITTTLELSGRDSAFVLADADVELAAGAIWNAVTMNGGQTCMAPRRVLVEQAIYNQFLSALTPHVSASQPRRLIDACAARRVSELARDAIDAGGRSLSGVFEPPSGTVMRPSAIVDCPPEAALVQANHFGPVVAVIPVRTLEDALVVHSQCDHHLATSIFTRDAARARKLSASISSGTVTINDCILPVAHPAASLGGRGLSGWGRSQGVDGLLAMTRTVHVSRTSRWLRPSTQAPTRSMLQQMHQLLVWLYGSGKRTSGHTPTRASRASIDLTRASSLEPRDATSNRHQSTGTNKGSMSTLVETQL